MNICEKLIGEWNPLQSSVDFPFDKTLRISSTPLYTKKPFKKYVTHLGWEGNDLKDDKVGGGMSQRVMSHPQKEIAETIAFE